MDEIKLQQLSAAYLNYFLSGFADEYSWASDDTDELVKKNPETALTVIKYLIDHNQNSKFLFFIAAGPLEDLLVQHGEQVIGLVEAEAKQNPKFKNFLAAVWKNRMTEEIWLRVLVASGRLGRFSLI